MHWEHLFHRRTRTAYVYNGRLAWYNVVLTPRYIVNFHCQPCTNYSLRLYVSSVRWSCDKKNTPLVTRATVELVYCGLRSLTLTYTTLDSGLTYNKLSIFALNHQFHVMTGQYFIWLDSNMQKSEARTVRRTW